MFAIVVAFFSLNTWSSGVDLALLNPLGNLYQVSQISLRFFPHCRNAKGCNWPIEGADVRFFGVTI